MVQRVRTVAKPDLLWVEKYLFIPYAERGFSFTGCNCWGLVVLAYSIELSLQLEDYSHITARRALAIEAAIRDGQNLPPWQKQIPLGKGEDRGFDLLVMRSVAGGESHDIHVGLVTAPGWMMHMTKEYGVMHVRYLDHPHTKNRLVGLWRHEAITHVK